MNQTELQEIARTAREHANTCRAEVDSAQNRERYVSLTALAMQANLIAANLETLTNWNTPHETHPTH